MKVTAKSVAFFFPEIEIVKEDDPNEVTVKPHRDIIVTYTRTPDGTVTVGELRYDDPPSRDRVGNLVGLIGKQWRSRCDPIAKKYFAEHPIQQAAE